MTLATKGTLLLVAAIVLAATSFGILPSILVLDRAPKELDATKSSHAKCLDLIFDPLSHQEPP